MAQHLDIPVVNAGDGMHEHPTQALLDAYTILRHKKTLKGLQVAIIGDIYHSRVARSAVHLLSKFGAKITFAVRRSFCRIPQHVRLLACTSAALLKKPSMARTSSWCCVSKKNGWRGQKSACRITSPFSDDDARLKLAKKDALLMHPGPIIRGLELTWEVADCPQSAIVEEVRNGVPVRMAVLAKALGKAR